MRIEHVPPNSNKQALIRIEGLAEPLTLVHVTDSHMNETDKREGGAILEQSYREYAFDALETRTNFNRVLDYANELSADCMILTGDIVNGATAKNLHFLEERLTSLRSPFLYTPGNHDWEYPGEAWGEGTRQSQYAKFNRLTEGNPAYQSKTIGGVRLITIDNSTYQFSEDQLDFVKRELALGLPTLFFMHIPIYIPSLLGEVLQNFNSPIMIAGEGWDAQRMEEWKVEPASESTLTLYRLLWDNPFKNIVGVFCGHVHFAHQDPFGQGSYQYVTQAGFSGGYRVIRLLPLEALEEVDS